MRKVIPPLVDDALTCEAEPPAAAVHHPSSRKGGLSKLTVDVVAGLIYIVAANPLLTGWAVHEWVSLGLLLIFALHCAQHLDWVVATIRRHADTVSRAHLVLDVATLVVFMVATVSGLAVSRHILPALGLVTQGYFLWVPVHAISAKLLLALLIVHVATHVKWALAAIRAQGQGQGKT